MLNLTGLWEVTNAVETTTYSGYAGLELGFRVELRQDGSRVFGHGYKVSENRRELRAGRRTAIEVEGRVVNNRVALSYREHGPRRVSVGTIALEPMSNSTLRGTFQSDVASSRGRSIARRTKS
jgi:hypothetical protein